MPRWKAHGQHEPYDVRLDVFGSIQGRPGGKAQGLHTLVPDADLVVITGLGGNPEAIVLDGVEDQSRDLGRWHACPTDGVLHGGQYERLVRLGLGPMVG